MDRSFPGISINPEVRFGKPCVAGTRVTVAEVLHWLSIGMSFEEIVDDFPYLSIEKIRQVLAYAANKENRYMIIAA
jgi:uncharacterized protein (DUF433 family)